MIRPGQPLFRWLLFPFLLPVFFVLHQARTFFGVIPAGDLLRMSALYTGLSLVLYFALRLFARYREQAAVSVFWLMAAYLYWGPLCTWIAGKLPGFTLVHLPGVLVVLLGIIIVCWRLLAKAEPGIRSRILFFLNVLLLIYISIDLGVMGWKALDPPAEPAFTRQKPASVPVPAQRPPNIYLLLFDEYTSGQALLEEWGYRNNGLERFLQSRGFSIQPQSRANYNLTPFSMASLLNMNYLETLPAGNNLDPIDYRCAGRWIDQNLVVGTLKKAGYRFDNQSIFRVDGQAAAGLPGFMDLDGPTLIGANTFGAIFRKEYLPFLKKRLHGPVVYHSGPDDEAILDFDRYNEALSARLLQTAGRKEKTPVFLYAHFIMPHLPFCYDSLDRRMDPERIRAADERLDPAYYGYNVTHTNKKIQQLVDTILSREQGQAIILLLGDHGFRKSGRQEASLFANLNAVYFPGRDYRLLWDSMSNVNLFRMVLNQSIGTRFPRLPDSTIQLGNR